MRVKRLTLCTAILVVVAALQVPAAKAQFANLAKRIPADANVIVLWNAEKVFASSIAKREGWAKNYEKAFESGLVPLPADTLQYMAASQLDLTTMQPVWQVSMIVTGTPHSMEEIAKKRKASVTSIAGHKAVLLPSNSYLVQFGPNTYGSMTPADRQTASRWIRMTETMPRHTAYITAAIGYAEVAGTEIIMAMDLQDAVAPERVQQKIAESTAVKDAGLDASKLAPILAGLQGITLGITFADQPYGKLKADFATDVSMLGSAAKPLFLEALGNNGLMIEDLQSPNWKGAVSGKQATLAGYFSKTGMRRVLSLIDAPATTSVGDDAIQSASDVDPKVVASQSYFKSVNSLLTEFRHRDSPTTIYQIGTWLDKYARKVDQLPMVNVDKELIDYGTYVSQQLRNASAAIKGIGYKTRVGEVAAANSSGPGYYGQNYDGGYYHDGYYYRGGYGAGRAFNFQAGLQAEQKARTQVHSAARVQGGSAARAIMQELENAERMMRVKMTEKYNVDF